MLNKLSKTTKMILAGSLLILALGGAGVYYLTEIRAEEEPTDWSVLCEEEANRALRLMQFRQNNFSF
jgi:hypothetical protein